MSGVSLNRCEKTVGKGSVKTLFKAFYPHFYALWFLGFENRSPQYF